MTTEEPVREVDPSVLAFWEIAKRHARLANVPGYFGPGELESLPPSAWSFSADATGEDDLLATLLADGVLTTRTPVADYEAAGADLPVVGTLGIVLDAEGRPRALVTTSEVSVVDDVVAETITVLHRAE